MLKHGLGFVRFLVNVRLHVSASAAQAISQLQGFAKLNFLEFKTLRLQRLKTRSLMEFSKSPSLLERRALLYGRASSEQSLTVFNTRHSGVLARR